jgi:hypothetical protein
MTLVLCLTSCVSILVRPLVALNSFLLLPTLVDSLVTRKRFKMEVLYKANIKFPPVSMEILIRVSLETTMPLFRDSH